MKFSEMPYERPDFDAAKAECAALCERIRRAPDAGAALAAARDFDALSRRLTTMFMMVEMRNIIDTRDYF